MTQVMAMDDEEKQWLERCFEAKIEPIGEEVRRIAACLYGDNNPGGGLTGRVSTIETQHKWITRLGIAIITLLLMLLGIKEIPKIF